MLVWTLCYWDNCNGNYPRADFWRPGWLPSVTSVGHCPGREVLPPGVLGFLWMSVEVALQFLLGTCTPWPTPAPSAHKELWIMRTTSNKPVPLVAVSKVELWGMEFYTPLLSPRRIHPTPVKERTSGVPPPFLYLQRQCPGRLGRVTVRSWFQ